MQSSRSLPNGSIRGLCNDLRNGIGDRNPRPLSAPQQTTSTDKDDGSFFDGVVKEKIYPVMEQVFEFFGLE